MIQPDELKRTTRLTWSPGMGTDVWEMFCACIAGDLEAVQRLVAKDPSLVRCHYVYRRPIYFAVRENQLDIVRFLIDQGEDPSNSGAPDTLLQITDDRGYVEMRQLLESALAGAPGILPKGEAIAAAIRERHRAKVLRLIDESPELVHSVDGATSRPIHWAVMTRQIDIIDDLLARGADINAKRRDGARPIHVTNGDYNYRGWRDVPADVVTTPREVYDHLVARGAEIDMGMAAATGNIERVRELLARDPSLADRVSEYGSYYVGCGAPIKNAAATGHIEIVKLLLAYGADPNLPEVGMAPHGHALYSAVSNGHFEIARLLLENGAYPNPEVESSADALTIAMGRGDQRMIDLLCVYGAARSVSLLAHAGDIHTAAAVFAANPALADDPAAFANAASNGGELFVRLMLRYQPDLARRISVDRYWNIGAKTRELTEYLFAHGMNPSQPDWMRITPLHHFAMRGDIENAALYLDHGADIDARDEDLCSTPLGWAAKSGQTAMVEFLLKRGAKRTLPDDPPWATPLAWATRRGHREVVEILKNGDL
jgi:ankyrin repeat protein